jgi:DNA-binding transcriptional LysR family regulator
MFIIEKMNITSLSLDSDLLRTFLTVARHGSVTRGASALNRTQSAVSIQIKRLEESLAVALFHRRSRGVSLTEAGERLLPAAERITADLDRTARAFRADPVGGLVRVGIPDEYGSRVLPLILADFTARYPAVEVQVRCGFSVEYPDAIARGELDLAVFADDRPAPGADRLMTDPTVWVASRPYQCRADEPVPLALFDRACWWRQSAIDALEAAGQPYRLVFSSESVAGIKAAVGGGLAVGVLGRSTVDSDMQVLDSQYGFPALPPSVLRLLRGDGGSPAVAAMASAIENGFRRLN